MTLHAKQIMLIKKHKENAAKRREAEELAAAEMVRHAVQGWFLMCDGCRAVVAMGQNRDRVATCLGAAQEGWRFDAKDAWGGVYCPKCL